MGAGADGSDSFRHFTRQFHRGFLKGHVRLHHPRVMRQHQREHRTEHEQKCVRVRREVRPDHEPKRIERIKRRPGIQRMSNIIFYRIQICEVRSLRRRNRAPDPESRGCEQRCQGGQHGDSPPPVGNAAFEQPRARERGRQRVQIERGQNQPPAGGADPGRAAAAKPPRDQRQQQGGEQDRHLRSQQFEVNQRPPCDRCWKQKRDLGFRKHQRCALVRKYPGRQNHDEQGERADRFKKRQGFRRSGGHVNGAAAPSGKQVAEEKEVEIGFFSRRRRTRSRFLMDCAWRYASAPIIVFLRLPRWRGKKLPPGSSLPVVGKISAGFRPWCRQSLFCRFSKSTRASKPPPANAAGAS